MRAARNVAKVQLALETITREFLREAGDKVRRELAEQLDYKTKWVYKENLAGSALDDHFLIEH